MLKGKTALVTGSTSGIGLGIAKALADAGADIVLNGFGKPSENVAIQQEVASKKVRVRYHSADLTQPEEIEAMFQEIGPVDILVNNAGIQHVSSIIQFPVDKWHSIIALNLTAVFLTTKAALPSMISKKWGRIVNIASAHGLRASPFKSAYVSTKHGVIGLTKVTALEIAEHGITCNAICPGYVDTPLVQDQIADQAKAHNMSKSKVAKEILLVKHPNKEFVTIEEVAGATVYLCSPLARSITGTFLSIDGGWTAY